jgi:hypothetical protein
MKQIQRLPGIQKKTAAVGNAASYPADKLRDSADDVFIISLVQIVETLAGKPEIAENKRKGI